VAVRIAAREPDVVVVERDSVGADLLSALRERGFPLVELDRARGVLSVLIQRSVSVQGIEDLAQARFLLGAKEQKLTSLFSL
jgi:hypothetical protein